MGDPTHQLEVHDRWRKPLGPDGAPGAYEVVYGRPARQVRAEDRFKEQRTVRMPGPAAADLSESVLLLADTDGRVERILNLSRLAPDAFDKQVASLEPLRLEWPRPDGNAHKAIWYGFMTCTQVAGCTVELSFGRRRSSFSLVDEDSIRFTSLDPKEGTTLRRGQKVTVVATGRYQIPAEGGSVGLVVLNRSARAKALAESPPQPVSAGDGAVTLTATFTVPEDAQGIELYFAAGALGMGVASSSAVFVVR